MRNFLYSFQGVPRKFIRLGILLHLRVTTGYFLMVLPIMIIIIGMQSVLVSLLKVNHYSIKKHVMLDMTAG